MTIIDRDKTIIDKENAIRDKNNIIKRLKLYQIIFILIGIVIGGLLGKFIV